jgi:enolase
MVRKMPIPLCNILNGGKHGDNLLCIQEFMITPIGASNFTHAVQILSEVFHSFKEVLKKHGFSTNVGDEGGFSPNIQNHQQALDLIMEAICESHFSPGKDITLALDVAASEFFKQDYYFFEEKQLNSHQMIDYYEHLIKNYPITSIEDGLAEDDWDGWSQMTNRLGKKIQLVGDDLFVTNTSRLQRGIEQGIANSILIKPNQIGTISEMADAIEMAHRYGYRCIMSHRSGETEDTSIADLAVAFETGQIKTGSVSRTDRVAKYNQLMRIEASLLSQSMYEKISF